MADERKIGAIEIDRLYDFLDGLQASGYIIDVRQYVALNDLLMALIARGDSLEEVPLKTLIAPLICSTSAEQQDFYQRFDGWYPTLLPVKQASLSGDGDFPESKKRKWSFPAINRTMVVWMSSAIVVITLFIWWILNLGTVGTAGIEGIAGTQVDNNIIFYGVTIAFIVFAIWLGWRIWNLYQENQYITRELANQEPVYTKVPVVGYMQEIMPVMQFKPIVSTLRKRTQIPSSEVDVDRTIENALNHDNWLEIVYRQRQVMPEYVVLIDRKSRLDQQARFVQEVLEKLASDGVWLHQYEFSGDPRICFPLDRKDTPLRLKDLQSRHPDTRLLIFSGSNELINPLTGLLQDWLESLSHWQERAILTPDKLQKVLLEELQSRDFAVLPMTFDGLASLVRTFETETPHWLTNGAVGLPVQLIERPMRWTGRDTLPEDEVKALVDDLKNYLGDNGFYWLCATAVYPELRWELTLHLGSALKNDHGQPLLTPNLLIDLARLPWFRLGYMPDWTRRELIKGFTSTQEISTRDALSEMLSTAFSGEGFDLKFGSKSKDTFKMRSRKFLNALFRNIQAESVYGDYIFTKFILNSKNQMISIKLPQTLRRIIQSTSLSSIYSNIRIGVSTEIDAMVARLLVRVRRTRSKPLPFSEENSVTGSAVIHADDVSRLSEVAEIISGQQDYSKILASITESARDALNCDLVTLFTYNETNDTMDIPIVSGVRYRPGLYEDGFESKESIVWKILKSNESIFVQYTQLNEFDRDSMLDRFVQREAISSLAAVPLLAGVQRAGVLFAGYRSTHLFSEQEKSSLQLFASQAALAIYNALLIEKAEKKGKYLEVVRNASKALAASAGLGRNQLFDQLLKLAVDFIGHSTLGTIQILHEQTNNLEFTNAYPSSEYSKLLANIGLISLNTVPLGITGRAAVTKKSQLVSGVYEDSDYIRFSHLTRSELAVPLLDGDHLIGVLNLESDKIGAFSGDDVELLEALANAAVVTLKTSERAGHLPSEQVEREIDQFDTVESSKKSKASRLQGDAKIITESVPKIFICYSHKDESFKDELVTMLTGLQRRGVINVWEDRPIEPGDEWRDSIKNAMNTCDLALLLVSADFLNSEYILDQELPRLLQRRKAAGLRVVPIIVRDCLWQSEPVLKDLQALPKSGKPVFSFSKENNDRDLAWVEIITSIEGIANKSSGSMEFGTADKSLTNNNSGQVKREQVITNKEITSGKGLSSLIFADRYRFEPVGKDWDRGRSGYTHLVYDLKASRLGVIKRSETSARQSAESLQNEVKALRALSGSGVPEVYDAGQAVYASKNYDYMVIEYIDGVRVEKNLNSLSVVERAEILTQFFGLLAQAHRQGIVSGDIDLKHLFWRRKERQLVIVDWGNAKLDVVPKKKTEFAYDLARSAEIIFALVTRFGHPPATGSIVLPDDSALVGGLGPLPLEFRNLCKWAPRTPFDGAQAPYTAQELFEIARKWSVRAPQSQTRPSRPFFVTLLISITLALGLLWGITNITPSILAPIASTSVPSISTLAPSSSTSTPSGSSSVFIIEGLVLVAIFILVLVFRGIRRATTKEKKDVINKATREKTRQVAEDQAKQKAAKEKAAREKTNREAAEKAVREKAERKVTDVEQLKTDRYRIALWGPTASGKTWFIQAFARKLLNDYSDDPDFSFEIRDASTNMPISAYFPENVDGTQQMTDIAFLFSRVPKKNTEAHKISAYQHFITVRDDKGSSTFSLEGVDNDRTRLSIINSDYLLVMLDPTSLSSPASSDSSESTRENPIISVNEYAERIRMLFETLIKGGKDKHYCIAVCITKTDQLGGRRRDPWEIIQMYFGRSMFDYLKQYSQMPQFTIETFSTSAFGFVGGVKAVPNYEDGNLMNRENWQPYNVEAPLFWLFEMVERKKLTSIRSSFFERLLFSKSRLNSYIPYRIKRR